MRLQLLLHRLFVEVVAKLLFAFSLLFSSIIAPFLLVLASCSAVLGRKTSRGTLFFLRLLGLCETARSYECEGVGDLHETLLWHDFHLVDDLVWQSAWEVQFIRLHLYLVFLTTSVLVLVLFCNDLFNGTTCGAHFLVFVVHRKVARVAFVHVNSVLCLLC